MKQVLEDIRAELKRNGDELVRRSFQRFFKEEVRCYGVKTGVVGKIARKYWQEVKGWEKVEIWALCEELFRSDYTEEAFVASFWGPKLTDKFEREDLVIFRNWIEKYINNWAKCDGFCNHTIGNYIVMFPDEIKELKAWSQSNHRWLKRASAVSLIVPARKGAFLREVFAIADQLLLDDDDMVQKGYGWLLKEASRQHQQEVLEYVLRNKEKMPRTALRYAIELMPQEYKMQAMRKERKKSKSRENQADVHVDGRLPEMLGGIIRDMAKKEMIGYCGLCCLDCHGYKQEIPDLSRDLRKELRGAKYQKFAHALAGMSWAKVLAGYDTCYEVLGAMVKFRCHKGCKKGGGPPFCKIRICCQKKGYEGCWECSEVEGCGKLDFLRAVHEDGHLKNIRMIKKQGTQKFLLGKRNW